MVGLGTPAGQVAGPAPGDPVTGFIRQPDGTDQRQTMTRRDQYAALNGHGPMGGQGGPPPLYVSYFTPGSAYETLARQLRQSLDAHALPYRIEPRPSRGSWVANTCIKPEFIAEIWSGAQRPVCWIDADAAVLRPPGFLNGCIADFAFVRRHGWYDISSLVYFGTAPVCGEVLAEWVRLAQSAPHVWDQALLTLAWHRVLGSSPAYTWFLPDSIFRFPRPHIRDLRDRLLYYPTGRKLRPFFDQKQASRSQKRADGARETPSDAVSPLFRDHLQSFDFSQSFSVRTAFVDD